ncbi:hypothetical protein EJ02DRAFT_359753 [Clathrospora elynae]|uniref:Uncharacterized protein n=1 Tax=Clathrospora elynae TaxID=706981 RepID=A0A6A5S9E6_9PLEO|nr:hypothetical protein EJ02DRAFT_359753 [Clathrospora elynae]
MSGIEIAGLVLGPIPLLIHALDSYLEGAEALRDWWRIESTCHQLLSEGNVVRFLLALVVDEDELKTLMDDPAGQSWEDPELEQRLQERLPKSYPIFLDIIRDINALVDLMKQEPQVSSKSGSTRRSPNPVVLMLTGIGSQTRQGRRISTGLVKYRERGVLNKAHQVYS